MTEKRFEFEPDCIECNVNTYDYSLLNSHYEADVERNEIIEWNKDACNVEYRGLERIADKLNFKQMQLEECRKGYEKLLKENEQLKSDIKLIEERADKVYDENEQLKQQCKDFMEMLDDMSVAYLVNDGLEEILNE